MLLMSLVLRIQSFRFEVKPEPRLQGPRGSHRDGRISLAAQAREILAPAISYSSMRKRVQAAQKDFQQPA
jgi:hypothetical protein